jgi:hypothetical protein
LIRFAEPSGSQSSSKSRRSKDVLIIYYETVHIIKKNFLPQIYRMLWDKRHYMQGCFEDVVPLEQDKISLPKAVHPL